MTIVEGYSVGVAYPKPCMDCTIVTSGREYVGGVQEPRCPRCLHARHTTLEDLYPDATPAFLAGAPSVELLDPIAA